jgi:hypothetical protein
LSETPIPAPNKGSLTTTPTQDEKDHALVFNKKDPLTSTQEESFPSKIFKVKDAAPAIGKQEKSEAAKIKKVVETIDNMNTEDEEAI